MGWQQGTENKGQKQHDGDNRVSERNFVRGASVFDS